ncbi:MAG: SDR family NAD(P)-dependent oxidoreductase [Verrucomicrobiota bacterium]
MKRNTAVITGSTGGIGQEVSKILAEEGWNLVLLNRSSPRSENQCKELKAAFPDQVFTSYTADLMDLSEISEVADEIGNHHPEIHALYNIAGILTDKRLTSAQGMEGHFVVNVLAPYLLLQKLRGLLHVAPDTNAKPVIVNLSSSAIQSVRELDVSKLPNPDEIGGLMGAYAKSKVAVTMIAEIWEKELTSEGILIHSVDPGPTKTAMTGGSDGMPWFLRLLRPLIFKSAEAQAMKMVDAVSRAVEEEESGIFISEGKRKEAPAIVHDKELQSDLRELLEEKTSEFVQ